MKMSHQNDIYNKIKTGIIYGELDPGEKLSEIELPNKSNSSRMPVREAFRQLQMEGYITVSHNRGAYVSKLASILAAFSTQTNTQKCKLKFTSVCPLFAEDQHLNQL